MNVRRNPKQTDPSLQRLVHEVEGVQIVELALMLPILMVLLVGVFDFGNAFNLKQKLTNTVRAASRFASSSLTNDLNSGGTPNSIAAIKTMVDDHLTAEGINDCGLAGQTGVSLAPAQYLWTFTASGNGCPGTLTLTIDRSCCTAGTLVTASTPAVQIVSTHVQLSYPYQWQYGGIFRLIGPTSTYATGVTQISSEAYVPNLD